MVYMRNTYRILVRKPERDHSEYPDRDVRIILEWILGKDGKLWTGVIWFKIGTSGRLL